ncbi:MAG TPA: GNAT family N-acetyltransferase [Blastocatellia bacterium]|nr:GNAT family N-acetyltransferase [Blastocatellia bacterium]
MFEWEASGKHFVIREAESEAEYHAVEDLQREAWGFSDLDIVPAATLIATRWAGGLVLGAFDGDRMIGFAYGFPAYEDGRASIHSHMLAVKPEYRNAQAGFYLKLAQRDFALGKGLDEITWTFDPLQSLNAHLNFSKLGVISRRYIVNFYGESSSSPLHQGFGTDRLWVRWLLASDNVRERVSKDRQTTRSSDLSQGLEDVLPSALVRGDEGLPRLADFGSALSNDRCFIEIPHDITSLKERDPDAGRVWREATRAAFLASLEAGFTVRDFLRADEARGPRWFYLLAR